MVRKLLFPIIGLWLLVPPSLAAPAPFFVGQGPAQPFRCFEDDQGGFYLVWVDGRAGQLAGLRAQHVDLRGSSLWDAPGLLVSDRLSSTADWSGLADGQGGVTLFWDEADGVHSQRFRPDGNRRRPQESVLMSTSTAIQPDAIADARGGTLVVWREILTTRRSVIMAQRFDPEGKPLWPSGGIRVCLRASDQTNPRVVYDNMSGMIVAWRDEANSASEIRVQRIDFEGNRLWSLEGLKITGPIGAADFPIMTSLETGSVAVAWTGSVNQTSQILLQKVGPEAALQWDPAIYASEGPTTYNRWNPLLIGDDGGGIWIGWEDFQNQANYQIQINHLDGGGDSLWPGGEIAAAPGSGDQGKMAMTGDGRGGIWLAWVDNRGATVGLYVQEIDGSGRRLRGPAGRLIADGLAKPSNPQLVTLGPGKAVVAWAGRLKKGQWSLSWAML